MAGFERLRDVVEKLVELRLVFNQRDFAEQLGYTEPSVSQIINGKLPISQRLLSKIKEKFPMINSNWITTGEGNMENSTLSLGKAIEHSATKEKTAMSIDNETIIRLVDMNLELAKSNNILAETAKDAVKASQDAISMAGKAIDNNQEKMDRLFTLLEKSLLKQPAVGVDGVAGMEAVG